MKMRHTVIAVVLAAASLSVYADLAQAGPVSQTGVIEFRAGKSRPDYDAWINANKPAHVKSTSAEELLEQLPFAPKDVNLFMPAVYSLATPTVPAAAPSIPVTDEQLRQQVSKVLSKRFMVIQRQSKAIKDGLAVMDDPAIKAKVADPRLRASLAMLKGTAGESAIDAIKNGPFTSVSFGTPPSNTTGGNTIAQVVDDGTGKPKIIMSDKYQYEDPRLLAPILFHETLHQDFNVSNREELMANGLDSLVYGQFVSENSSVASQGTELARRENTKLMALVNSRDEDGRIHLLSA